ncbi:MAG: RNA polymerase sigma factor [Dehalococcoidia bacterium]
MAQPQDQARRTIDEARRGDAAAWEALYTEHFPRIYRYFRSRIPRESDAEDLAAETFVDAFRGLHTFQWRERPFGAWMFGIARNRLRMYYRARKETFELDDALDAHVRDEFLDVDIRDILERLPANYRTVIELRYVLGLSGEEAAAAMGRSHGSTRKLLQRASEQFRSMYGEGGLA